MCVGGGRVAVRVSAKDIFSKKNLFFRLSIYWLGLPRNLSSSCAISACSGPTASEPKSREWSVNSRQTLSNKSRSERSIFLSVKESGQNVPKIENWKKKSWEPGFFQKIAKTVEGSIVVLEKIFVFSLLDLLSGMIRVKNHQYHLSSGCIFWKIWWVQFGELSLKQQISKKPTQTFAQICKFWDNYFCVTPSPPPLSQWDKIWASVFLHRSLTFCSI